MHLEQVHTQPDPYAPYLLSQAIRAGGLLFVSGQAGVGDDGAIVGRGDFDAQAEQAFRNLRRALQAGGSGLDRVAKVTIFLTSMEHFPKIVALRRKWFSAPYPADTIVEVSALYSPDAMIEIEAIALTTEGEQ
ncbi:RidA family protein [Cupriavidus alkaliphilus]|uniref:RidA family protein n=1 Tax=Cupriavidus alkaliphilus TaxID=942866 RepID=UPI000DC6007F|nr:RidA family protein [Cupriavidus alkaliphilus]MBB3014810.1 reactive intermediate/imine deaminase [Cupriavidus alkaliphilus]RAS04124.1 reactive intermediate/imine deaminase [Cupriavidus alkaliphilus]